MKTPAPKPPSNEDLLVVLEQQIDEEALFDARVRRKLDRAHRFTIDPHPDLRPEEYYAHGEDYYALCLDTLETIKNTVPTGLDTAFMQGYVNTYYGVFLFDEGRVDEAIDRLRASVSGFEASDRSIPEAVACVGLARIYHRQRNFGLARQYYERALLRLEKIRVGNVSLARFRDKTERNLDELDEEYVEGRSRSASTGPPPRRGGNGAGKYARKVPLYGNISAGLRMHLAQEYPEEELTLDEFVAADGDIGVTVVGDSLIEAGIYENDLAILRPVPRGAPVSPQAIAAVQVMPCGEEPAGYLKHVWKLAVDDNREQPYVRLDPENAKVNKIIVVPEGAAYGAGLAKEYEEKGQAVEVIEGDVMIVARLVGLIRQIP